MTASLYHADDIIDAPSPDDGADVDLDLFDPAEEQEEKVEDERPPPPSILKSHFKYSPRYSRSPASVTTTAATTTTACHHDEDEDDSEGIRRAPRRNSMDTSADVIRRHNARHRRCIMNRRNSLDSGATAVIFHDSFSSLESSSSTSSSSTSSSSCPPNGPIQILPRAVHFADGPHRDRTVSPPSVVTSVRCRPFTPASDVERLFYSSGDIRRFKQEYREVVKRALARRAERLLRAEEGRGASSCGSSSSSTSCAGIDNSAWRSKSGGRWHGSLTSGNGGGSSSSSSSSASSLTSSSSPLGDVIVDFGKRHRDEEREHEQEREVQEEDDLDQFVDAGEDEADEDDDYAVNDSMVTTSTATTTMGGIFSSVFDVARDVVSSLSSVPLSSECYSSTTASSSSFYRAGSGSNGSSRSYARTTSTFPYSSSSFASPTITGLYRSSSPIDRNGVSIHSRNARSTSSFSSSDGSMLRREDSSPTKCLRSEDRHYRGSSSSPTSSYASSSSLFGSRSNSHHGSGTRNNGRGYHPHYGNTIHHATSTASAAHLVDTLYLF